MLYTIAKIVTKLLSAHPSCNDFLGGTMIVEERIYSVQVGKTAEYLRIYEAEGLPIQLKHLGHLIGLFSSEVGKLNQITQLWLFKDLNDRDARRARLGADENWHAYLKRAGTLVQDQTNRLLRPAPSFSMRLESILLSEIEHPAE
jgi:hypothetical protein